MNNLKFLRELNNKNQSDIASIIKIDRSVYAKYESSNVDLSTDMLCTFADYYKVSTDYILNNTDNISFYTPSGYKKKIRLKQIRRGKGFSQETFAKEIGVSTSTLGNYEKERYDIPTDILIKSSKILNVSIDFILGRTDLPNSY